MDTDTLFDELIVLADAGDEQAIRTFLATHINEFPEEIRSQIVMFFFEEAVSDHAAGLRAEAELVENATNTLDLLGGIKQLVEDQIGVDAVRNRLKKHAENSDADA